MPPEDKVFVFRICGRDYYVVSSMLIQWAKQSSKGPLVKVLSKEIERKHTSIEKKFYLLLNHSKALWATFRLICIPLQCCFKTTQ